MIHVIWISDASSGPFSRFGRRLQGAQKMRTVMRTEALCQQAANGKLCGMGTQGELELICSVMKGRTRAAVTGPAAARWIGLPTLDRVTVVDLRVASLSVV